MVTDSDIDRVISDIEKIKKGAGMYRTMTSFLVSEIFFMTEEQPPKEEMMERFGGMIHVVNEMLVYGAEVFGKGEISGTIDLEVDSKQFMDKIKEITDGKE